MDDIQQLADAIYREKVLRARAMDPGEKFLDGPRLFEFACAFVEAGIRAQFPTADDSEVKRILRERIELQRRQEAPKWKQGTSLLP